MTKVRSKQDPHPRGTERGRDSSFCFADGCMQGLGVGAEVPKIQMTCVCGANFVSVANDGRKSYGCHCQTTRFCRTSSRRSVSLHPGKNERRSKSECPDIERDSLKKFCWDSDGEKRPELGVSICSPKNKVYSYPYSWMPQTGWKRAKTSV